MQVYCHDLSWYVYTHTYTYYIFTIIYYRTWFIIQLQDHTWLVVSNIFFHNISAQIITTSPDVTPEIDLSHWIKDTKGFKVSSFTRNGEKHG